MNSLLFQAAYHQVDDIPRADFTIRFGQKESPNACFICHRDQDSRGLSKQLANWKTATNNPTANLVYP